MDLIFLVGANNSQSAFCFHRHNKFCFDFFWLWLILNLSKRLCNNNFNQNRICIYVFHTRIIQEYNFIWFGYEHRIKFLKYKNRISFCFYVMNCYSETIFWSSRIEVKLSSSYSVSSEPLNWVAVVVISFDSTTVYFINLNAPETDLENFETILNVTVLTVRFNVIFFLN